MTSLHKYVRSQVDALARVTDSAGLDAWYAEVFGRSGRLPLFKRSIGSLPSEERASAGRELQQATKELGAQFEQRKNEIATQELAAALRREAKDVTFDGRPARTGGYHPVTSALRSICQVFEEMGFVIFESPHVELDEYNFQLLNIPQDHPARDMQDTFYVSPSVVLRTHTSAGQIRAMRTFAPEPCQVILPGLCYRNGDWSGPGGWPDLILVA